MGAHCFFRCCTDPSLTPRCSLRRLRPDTRTGTLQCRMVLKYQGKCLAAARTLFIRPRAKMLRNFARLRAAHAAAVTALVEGAELSEACVSPASPACKSRSLTGGTATATELAGCAFCRRITPSARFFPPKTPHTGTLPPVPRSPPRARASRLV